MVVETTVFGRVVAGPLVDAVATAVSVEVEVA